MSDLDVLDHLIEEYLRNNPIKPIEREAYRWAEAWHRDNPSDPNGKRSDHQLKFLLAVEASAYADVPGDLNMCGCMSLCSDDGSIPSARSYAQAWYQAMLDHEAWLERRRNPMDVFDIRGQQQ